EPDAAAGLLALAERHADARQPQLLSTSASALLEVAALERDPGAASAHARRAYELLRAGRGDGHWETGRAALELARLLAAHDRAKARDLLESALPALESQLGPEHPWSAAARELLFRLVRSRTVATAPRAADIPDLRADGSKEAMWLAEAARLGLPAPDSEPLAVGGR
ncbi:MAG: hypothetical protein NZ898_17640, partial [Myxococcota bacterium]|nr:hypothetical protein [Myxococcota bacterium]